MEMTTGQGMLGEELMGEWIGRDERLERIESAVDWDAAAEVLSELRCADSGGRAFRCG